MKRNMIKKILDISFLWWLQILCGVEIRVVLVNEVKCSTSHTQFSFPTIKKLYD